jgi:tryptophan halogenase
VEDDFTAFLHGEGTTSWEPRGTLAFPNFVRQSWFDGRVFRVGNAGAFLEPLEATAIGTAILQARSATHWINEFGAASSSDPADLDEVNTAMRSYICRDSLFIAWHYARGSRWDTPFWRYARRGLTRARHNAIARPHVAAMRPFIAAGRALGGVAFSACDDQAQWDRDILPLLRVFRPYGNFSELNFAQIGHGIGYYDARRRRTRAATAAAVG